MQHPRETPTTSAGNPNNIRGKPLQHPREIPATPAGNHHKISPLLKDKPPLKGYKALTDLPQQLKYYNRLIDYDDEDSPNNCCICNDKKKHVNHTMQVFPEHVTQNIVYFIGCKICKKFLKCMIYQMK